MNTEMLSSEFRKILGLEERAKHFYDHYIEQIEDKGIREKLISIRDDEITHIKIAKKLLGCTS